MFTPRHELKTIGQIVNRVLDGEVPDAIAAHGDLCEALTRLDVVRFDIAEELRRRTLEIQQVHAIHTTGGPA